MVFRDESRQADVVLFVFQHLGRQTVSLQIAHPRIQSDQEIVLVQRRSPREVFLKTMVWAHHLEQYGLFRNGSNRDFGIGAQMSLVAFNEFPESIRGLRVTVFANDILVGITIKIIPFLLFLLARSERQGHEKAYYRRKTYPVHT